MSVFKRGVISAFSEDYTKEKNERRSHILSAKLLRLGHRVTRVIYEGEEGFLVEDVENKKTLKSDLENLAKDFEVELGEIENIESKGDVISMPKGFWGNFGLYGVASQDWREEEIKRD